MDRDIYPSAQSAVHCREVEQTGVSRSERVFPTRLDHPPHPISQCCVALGFHPRWWCSNQWVEVISCLRGDEGTPQGCCMMIPPQGCCMMIPPQGCCMVIPPQGCCMTIPPQGCCMTIPPQGCCMKIPPQGCCMMIPPQGCCMIIPPRGC